MHMTTMLDHIRNGWLLAEVLAIPAFMKMRQEELDRIPTCSAINVRRRKTTRGVMGIGIRIFADLEFL